jgi:hypothetical protein
MGETLLVALQSYSAKQPWPSVSLAELEYGRIQTLGLGIFNSPGED